MNDADLAQEVVKALAEEAKAIRKDRSKAFVNVDGEDMEVTDESFTAHGPIVVVRSEKGDVVFCSPRQTFHMKSKNPGRMRAI